MAALAQMLCEAVENEDSREVDNLLKHGADPNLVLPNGIAAIHLAAGKESECSLRCLTLILQFGGDPNVRSMEELTPVHVAASWGCYKTLVFLLRKGGDPNLQDQEGNTATDLALEEGNRRCVVALQEYTERESEGTWPEENRGYCKNDSSLTDDITQMSSISLLLESSYDNSPLSSTKVCPFVSIPRNEHVRKRLDNAVTGSRMNLTDWDAMENLNRKQSPGDAINMLPPNDNPVFVYGDSCDDSLDINSDDIPALNGEIEEKNNASITGHCCKLNFVGIKHLSNKGEDVVDMKCLYEAQMQQAMISNGKNTLENLTTSRLLHSNSVTGRLNGLDVTSPDHVFVYSRDPTERDDDFENTVVVADQDGKRDLEEDMSSSSKYNSCDSQCYNSPGDSHCSSEKTRLASGGKVLHLENVISDCKNSGDNVTASQTPSCRTLNEQMPCLQTVHSMSKQEKHICALQNGEFTDIVTQSIKGFNEWESRDNIDAPSQSQTQMINHESDGERAARTLYVSQSPTISVEVKSDANHENDICELTDHLRHLMLSTKNSKTNLPITDKQYVSRNSGLSSVHFLDNQETLSINIHIKNLREKDPVLNDQLKAPMVLTRLQSNSNCSNDTLDILVAEPSSTVASEKDNTGLNDEMKNMMMSTKTFQSPSIMDQTNCYSFVTPRSKSRLHSSNSRHRNSSLFDDTMDMPQRGRRVRSPLGVPWSPQPPKVGISKRSLFPTNATNEQTQFSDMSFIGKESEEHSIKSEPLFSGAVVSGKKTSQAETTVNLSNFLTDDLSSSDTDGRKPVPDFHEMPINIGVTHAECANTWLTEDGEEGSSGEVGREDTINGTSFPLAPPFSGSFLHSTCLEDISEKVIKTTRTPRYSFSRLSYIQRQSDMQQNSSQLSTIHGNGTRDVPLSPGGRPVNVSQVEPVEYLYMDNDQGHTLIERHVPCIENSSNDITESSDDTIVYEWRDFKNKQCKLNQTPASNNVALELYRLSNNEITRRLRELGQELGTVTSQTRRSCILLLDKLIKEQLTKGKSESTGYNPELSLALRTFQIPDCHTDEATLSQEFDQPDKTRKWREGVLKSSFNYLLLDPRVTRNLPSRYHTLPQKDCFRTFVSSVFYVGKGKRSRPYCHLYEALTHYKNSTKQPCSKVQHILDIWNSGRGVISLHCFQNTIPVEAYTREACMVDAIGLKMLTNQKKGVYYGHAQSWAPTRRRRLGVHMLHRAMQIFLAEGERQLRPPDIRTGQ
ncbi:ankyrin repeat and LEM domain-containing protein 1 [Discoglossus pictus]